MSESKKTPSTPSKLRKVRYFSDTFKRKIVKDIEQGLYTVLQVSRLHEVSSNSVYRWLYKYSKHHRKGTRQVIEMESEANKTKQLLEKLAKVEQTVGQKQMHIDYLEKLVEIASEELGIDLKKNFDTKSYPFSINKSSNLDLK